MSDTEDAPKTDASATTPNISVTTAEDDGAEFKLGRKREREGSIEPSTPLASNEPVPSTETRDRRAPAKKNRTFLGTTSEEEQSPPRAAVPLPMFNSPGESKLNQIRARVKDLNWKDSEDVTQDEIMTPSENETLTKPVEGESAEAITADAISVDPPTTTSDPEEDVFSSPTNGPSSRKSSHASGTLLYSIPPETRAESPTNAKSSTPPPDEIPPVSATEESGNPDIPAIQASPRSSKSGSSTPPAEAQSGSADASMKPTIDILQSPTKDKSLKRKSRETGNLISPIAAEPHKRARDIDGKATVPGDSLPAEGSPKKTYPIKNQFEAWSTNTSPFLAATAGKPDIFADIPNKSASETTKTVSTGVKNQFETWSSGASPFLAATAGKPNIFADMSAKPAVWGKPTVSPPTSSAAASSAFASSGFAAFASGVSPFLTTTASSSKSSSPSLSGTGAALSSSTNAFGGKSSDDTDSKRKASPAPSFGEMLATKGDADEQKENQFGDIEEINLFTGEENERTVNQTRAKLYTMDSRDTYKERGVGLLKLNVRQSDGGGPRLVMRAEGVYRLILNAGLFSGVKCSLGQDPKFIRVSLMEDGKFVHHAIRVGNPKAAQDLLQAIKENIPGYVPDDDEDS